MNSSKLISYLQNLYIKICKYICLERSKFNEFILINMLSKFHQDKILKLKNNLNYLEFIKSLIGILEGVDRKKPIRIDFKEYNHFFGIFGKKCNQSL